MIITNSSDDIPLATAFKPIDLSVVGPLFGYVIKKAVPMRTLPFLDHEQQGEQYFEFTLSVNASF